MPRVEGLDHPTVRLAPLVPGGDAVHYREDATDVAQQRSQLERSGGPSARHGRRDERGEARREQRARPAHTHDGHVPPRGALRNGGFASKLHRATRARHRALAGEAGAREAPVRQGVADGRDVGPPDEPRRRRSDEGARARDWRRAALRRRAQHQSGRRPVHITAVPPTRIPRPTARGETVQVSPIRRGVRSIGVGVCRDDRRGGVRRQTRHRGEGEPARGGRGCVLRGCRRR